MLFVVQIVTCDHVNRLLPSQKSVINAKFNYCLCISLHGTKNRSSFHWFLNFKFHLHGFLSLVNIATKLEKKLFQFIGMFFLDNRGADSLFHFSCASWHETPRASYIPISAYLKGTLRAFGRHLLQDHLELDMVS